jgi:hypothetical protein
MLCPYCLQSTSGNKCQNKGCERDIPALYVQRQSKMFARPPAVLSIVGFRGHGKTVYLTSLLDQMERRLAKVWDKFTREGLDMSVVKNLQKLLADLRGGVLPEGTRRIFPEPSLHTLSDMPHFGTRELIIFDPAGESFEKTEAEMKDYAGFIKYARVVLFIVSPRDLTEPKDNNLNTLLQSYLSGMATMKGKTADQRLIVAYTKADMLREDFKAYADVLNHLQSPDYEGMKNPRKYLDKLARISMQLRAYTTETLGAIAFVRLAEKSFREVAFCAVSALGKPPSKDGRIDTTMEPRGVADPLYWLLKWS